GYCGADGERSVTESASYLAGIETPVVLVDLDKVERNIARLQAYADRHGLKLRPHIKTHKLPQIAAMQLKAGAVGVTCQKISEAEAMVAATPEIRDVLITYNIVGAQKLDRLAVLARKINLSVVADSDMVIDGLSGRFATEAKPLSVLVECNTGANRCGVATPEAAAALARRIAQSAGLRFAGLMTTRRRTAQPTCKSSWPAQRPCLKPTPYPFLLSPQAGRHL